MALHHQIPQRSTTGGGLTNIPTELEKEFGAEAHYIYKSHRKTVQMIRPNMGQRYNSLTA